MIILSVGDSVVTKKPHACGGSRFTVLRTGADVKLKCEKCGHVVMLSSEKAVKAVKTVILKGEDE